MLLLSKVRWPLIHVLFPPLILRYLLTVFSIKINTFLSFLDNWLTIENFISKIQKAVKNSFPWHLYYFQRHLDRRKYHSSLFFLFFNTFFLLFHSRVLTLGNYYYILYWSYCDYCSHRTTPLLLQPLPLLSSHNHCHRRLISSSLCYCPFPPLIS